MNAKTQRINTTKKGDRFENKVYHLIHTALSTGQLGLIATQCKVFTKKGYYSREREGEIKFDLTIELWPPNSKNYSLLYVIECKNYNHKIPVDDVEEFYAKIDQVSGANRKGIFITNNSFQKGGYNYAKNKGIMLIEVLSDDSLNIILHKTNRKEFNRKKNFNNTKFEKKLQKLILNLFKTPLTKKEKRVDGLEILSKKDIESIALEVLTAFNKEIIEQRQHLSLSSLKNYLTKNYNLTFVTKETLDTDEDILGLYDNQSKSIITKKEIQGTSRYPFVLTHEIGHFFLHSNLRINKNTYNNFKDSEFSFLYDKYELKNPKHWIEWQANYFASCLLMPEFLILSHLIKFQVEEGIRNKGQIFVDNQEVNQLLFRKTIGYLALKLKVAKINVIYRLKDLGIIIYAKKTNWEVDY
ncbi:MAG: restriction endonuclease [Saprospiraceae bacterium]